MHGILIVLKLLVVLHDYVEWEFISFVIRGVFNGDNLLEVKYNVLYSCSYSEEKFSKGL